MTAPEPKQRPLVTMVYLGRTLITNGKKTGYAWAVVDGKKLGEERCYSKLDGHTPGSIWTVEVEEGTTTIYPGSAVSLNTMWHDHDAVLRWQADDRAHAVTRHAEKRTQAFLKESDRLEANLAELHRLYYRMPGFDRSAFLAFIVQRITRGA